MTIAVIECRLNSDVAKDYGLPALASVGITVNRNAVPFDPRLPMVTSGLRIGTSALATRGVLAEDFEEVADVIAAALIAEPDADLAGLAKRVREVADRYPLYRGLDR